MRTLLLLLILSLTTSTVHAQYDEHRIGKRRDIVLLIGAVHTKKLNHDQFDRRNKTIVRPAANVVAYAIEDIPDIDLLSFTFDEIRAIVDAADDKMITGSDGRYELIVTPGKRYSVIAVLGPFEHIAINNIIVRAPKKGVVSGGRIVIDLTADKRRFAPAPILGPKLAPEILIVPPPLPKTLK